MNQRVRRDRFGNVNVAWHEKHPMPKNPSLDQRVKWHLAHAAACACREIPKTVLRELQIRGTKPPALKRRTK
jgi:hypothetical protein